MNFELGLVSPLIERVSPEVCLLSEQLDDVCLSPHAVMTLAGKAYFDAVSKVGENAVVSPVSRELGEFRASPGHIYLQQVKSKGGLPEIPHFH